MEIEKGLGDGMITIGLIGEIDVTIWRQVGKIWG